MPFVNKLGVDIVFVWLDVRVHACSRFRRYIYVNEIEKGGFYVLGVCMYISRLPKRRTYLSFFDFLG